VLAVAVLLDLLSLPPNVHVADLFDWISVARSRSTSPCEPTLSMR
jgi:hypothetical protein